MLSFVRREEPFVQKWNRQCENYIKAASKTVLVASASIGIGAGVFAMTIKEDCRGIVLLSIGIGLTYLSQCATETSKEEADLFRKIGTTSATCFSLLAASYYFLT